MGPQRELEIVDAVKGGDFQQFEILIKTYQSKLTTFIFRMVQTEDDARDICQDSLFQAYRSIGSFRGQSKFSTWIFQIAYNASLNFLKKKKRLKEWLHGETESLPDTEVRDDPLRKMEKTELKVEVNRILNQLPSRYALPLHLFYKEGLLYREIADILKKPLNSIKSDLLRGKEMIKERMTGYVR